MGETGTSRHVSESCLDTVAAYRVFSALAASLLFSLAVIAFLRGTADIAGVPARVSMGIWEKQNRISSQADWQRAFDGLRFARSINPLNADYSADMGRLLEWQAWRHNPGSIEHTRYREYADRLYRVAAMRRPSWGFGWAHVAENRWLLGYRDGIYLESLHRAMNLAPWEPGVQRKVARVGMASWGSLPDAARAGVRDTVRRALDLAVHSDEIVRLAYQYDWTDELLPLIRTRSQHDVFDFVSRQASDG